MGFALHLALRYLRARGGRFLSVSTLFAILGVGLGTAALVAVMSVTGGFRAEFQKKVLGVNGHVIVLRSPFEAYRDVLSRLPRVPGVMGVSPFLINPMMVSHGGRTQTGVTVKGVDPALVHQVLDLPEQIVDGSLRGLLDTPERAHARALAAAGRELVWAEPSPSAAELDAGAAYGIPVGRSELLFGSVVPDGGYSSVLPDDDVLPEEVDPDPCQATRGSLPGMVVGVGLQQQLGLELGSCVMVTSPTIGYSFDRRGLSAPIAKLFEVVGVFHAGFEQYDAKFAYTNLTELQAFHRDPNAVTGLELKVRDADRASEVARDIEERLGSRLYTVMDWMELNSGLFTALKIQQLTMGLVLGLIVIVASFTVVATLVLLVLAKRREIAVAKSMGATDAQILRAFLYQGFFIGLSGTGSGLGIGYLLCRWLLIRGFPLDPKVYFIERLPVLIRTEDFVLTGAFAMVACLLATLWPAVHAARLRPIEAFRGS